MNTKTTDYISRRDLLARYDAEHTGAPGRARELIEQAPATDVAPVVHARWGDYEAFPLVPSMNGYPCGNCGMHFSASAVPVLKYCPNCGAKMDKEEV